MYIKIYKEKKSATQSSMPANHWVLEVVINKDSIGHNNPMNWNSSYDTLKQIKKMNFKDRSSAEEFARLMKMDIVSIDPEIDNKSRKKKTYLENYQG